MLYPCPFCSAWYTNLDMVTHMDIEHSPTYARIYALSLRLGYQEKQHDINAMLRKMRMEGSKE